MDIPTATCFCNTRKHKTDKTHFRLSCWRTGNMVQSWSAEPPLSSYWAHCPQTIQLKGCPLSHQMFMAKPTSCLSVALGHVEMVYTHRLQTSSHTEATYSLPALLSVIFLPRRMIAVPCANSKCPLGTSSMFPSRGSTEELQCYFPHIPQRLLGVFMGWDTGWRHWLASCSI